MIFYKLPSTPPELPDVMKPGADTAAQVKRYYVFSPCFFVCLLICFTLLKMALVMFLYFTNKNVDFPLFLIPWFFAGANRGLGTNISAVLKRDQFRKSSPTGLPLVKNCQSAGDQFVIGLVDKEPVLYYNFHREPSNTQDRLEIIPWTGMRRISSWSSWPMWPCPWSSWSSWWHFDFEQSPQKFWGRNCSCVSINFVLSPHKNLLFSHQWSWDLKRSCGPSFEV